MNKKFTLLQLFSLVDGRLSTKMDDVYDMLNHICDEELFTHQLPTAMDYLKSKNPEWFQELKEYLSDVKEALGTDDFKTMMNFVEDNNEEFDIPQLKDEVDISNLGSFITENSLLISKKEKRRMKLEKLKEWQGQQPH
jgi:hypothetical protein